MSECQICGREIKDKLGVIAHHGYTRPEQGWQTASCIGARQLPYEKSQDIIPQAIKSIQLFIANQEHIIEQVKINKIAVPNILGKSFIEQTDKFYSIRANEYIAKLEYQIKNASREIERLQKRYDDWKLAEVIK